MELDYEIEIAEPRKFMFDINIKFVIDDNPHTIRIEDVLGGDYLWESYQLIDLDAVIDMSIEPDEILGFIREPFKVIIKPESFEGYNFSPFRTLTLIDSKYSYIALNKLKSTLTADDKEVELFRLLKHMLVVGFTFLEKHIEKKQVEEKFNKND